MLVRAAPGRRLASDRRGGRTRERAVLWFPRWQHSLTLPYRLADVSTRSPARCGEWTRDVGVRRQRLVEWTVWRVLDRCLPRVFAARRLEVLFVPRWRKFSRYRCERVVEPVIYRLQEYACCVHVFTDGDCTRHSKVASRGNGRTLKETLVLANFASSLLFVRRKFLHGVAR